MKSCRAYGYCSLLNLCAFSDRLHSLVSQSFHSDGNMFVSGGVDNQIHVWSCLSLVNSYHEKNANATETQHIPNFVHW